MIYIYNYYICCIMDSYDIFDIHIHVPGFLLCIYYVYLDS